MNRFRRVGSSGSRIRDSRRATRQAPPTRRIWCARRASPRQPEPPPTSATTIRGAIAMLLNGFLGAEPPAFEPAEDSDERLNEVPS